MLNIAIALVLLVGLGGCTVGPLYGGGGTTGATAGTSRAAFSDVAVEPAGTRYEQEFRNHLVFLLHGGSGEPQAPRYRLEPGVTASTMASASIQVAAENRPTAGMVTMTSNYRLVDTTTGDVISSGTRRVSASFDKPRQEFAAYRAERDAQDRAARELAELIRHAIAQDLAAAARG